MNDQTQPTQYRQIGNYRILQLLGSGGFAKVYLGEHLYLGTRAAIKVLHAQVEHFEIEHFRLEARTIANLLHPHIVRVLDFGVQDSMPFLVMEYAPGGTLRSQHPRGSRLPLNMVVAYIAQAAEALQHAHENKIIHRDVKPENMLLNERQQLVISDFGVAAIAHNTRSQVATSIGGTISYAAPEQLQGMPVKASDQYALAIVAYEWLAGTPPFRGNINEIGYQHLLKPPPPLSQARADLPPALEQTIARALAKEPHERFPDIKTFALELAQAALPTRVDLFMPAPGQTPPAAPASQTPEAQSPFVALSSGPTDAPAQQRASQSAQPGTPAPGTPAPFTGQGADSPSGQGANPPFTQPTSGTPSSGPQPPLPPAVGQPLNAQFSAPPATGNAPHINQGPSSQAAEAPLQRAAAAIHNQTTLSDNWQAPNPSSVTGLPVRKLARQKKPLIIAALILLGILLAGSLISLTALNAQHQSATHLSNGTASSSAQISATARNKSTTKVGQPGTRPSPDQPTPTPSLAPDVNATATAQASTPQGLYHLVTSRQPTLSNALSAQDTLGLDTNSYCSFASGAYQMHLPGTNLYYTCYAENTSYCNAAVQVDVTIAHGDRAGLIIRNTVNSQYRWAIGVDGSSDLVAGGAGPLWQGSSPAIQQGTGSTNTLTMIAQGSKLSLYINGEFITSLTDSSSSCGSIGFVGVVFASGSTTATFQNLKVWTL